MVWKLVALILVAGATACGLLVIRQGRIDAAYDMSQLHRRMTVHEQSLWRMRTRVHELVRSDRVLRLVTAYQHEMNVEMTPIRIEAPAGSPGRSEAAPETKSTTIEENDSSFEATTIALRDP